MFNLKKGGKGESITLSINGMHCTSCAMNIDGALEDLEGVIESNTNYAKQKTVVVYNPEQVDLDTIRNEIEALDYKVRELE